MFETRKLNRKNKKLEFVLDYFYAVFEVSSKFDEKMAIGLNGLNNMKTIYFYTQLKDLFIFHKLL
jgi:hypothetical protein